MGSATYCPVFVIIQVECCKISLYDTSISIQYQLFLRDPLTQAVSFFLYH